MRDRLIGMGAGDRALAGTVVVDVDKPAFRAVYYVDTEHVPPFVVQLSLPTAYWNGNGVATLTRAGVTPDDEPLVSLDRMTVTEGDDPASTLTRFLGADEASELRTSGSWRADTFDTTYGNVEAFEPDIN